MKRNWTKFVNSQLSTIFDGAFPRQLRGGEASISHMKWKDGFLIDISNICIVLTCKLWADEQSAIHTHTHRSPSQFGIRKIYDQIESVPPFGYINKRLQTTRLLAQTHAFCFRTTTAQYTFVIIRILYRHSIRLSSQVTFAMNNTSVDLMNWTWNEVLNACQRLSSEPKAWRRPPNNNNRIECVNNRLLFEWNGNFQYWESVLSFSSENF